MSGTGDVIGYYTSERRMVEHIAAVIRKPDEWAGGEPLCGKVQSRSVYRPTCDRPPLVELRAIIDTPPRLWLTRCPRCQAVARRRLSMAEDSN